MGPAEVSTILTLLLGTSPDGSRAPFASADGAARAAACAAEVCRQHGRPTAGLICRPPRLRTPPHLFPGPPEGLGLAYLPRSAA